MKTLTYILAVVFTLLAIACLYCFLTLPKGVDGTQLFITGLLSILVASIFLLGNSKR